MDEQENKTLLEESASISIEDLTELLKASEYQFKLRHLFRLSGIEGSDLTTVRTLWPTLETARRRILLEDMEDLAGSNTLADFESIYTIGLEDEDAELRMIATRCLSESENPAIVTTLLRLLENDSVLTVRVQAANTLSQFIYLGELGKLTTPRYQELFEKLHTIATAADLPVELKQACVAALGYNTSNERTETLIENTYNLDDADWVTAALIAMGRSADSRWEEIVLEELENNEASVRFEAVRAAGRLEIEEAIKILTVYLNESDRDIRHASVWALAEIGGKQSQRALEMLLVDNEDEAENELLNEAIEHININDELHDFSLLDIPEFDGDENDKQT